VTVNMESYSAVKQLCIFQTVLTQPVSSDLIPALRNWRDASSGAGGGRGGLERRLSEGLRINIKV
jgi:hypothetical protein